MKNETLKLTGEDILKDANDSLEDSVNKLIVIAKDTNYINKDTREFRELLKEITERIDTSFAVKNILQDLENKKQ